MKADGSGAECEGGVQVVDGRKVIVGIIDVGLLVTWGGG